MAIFEWRKFNFFDLKENVDFGKVEETTKNNEITSCTSALGQNLICDSAGFVHIFYRNWQDCISFKAHDFPINYCCIAKRNNLLVTISSDDDNPIFKVWNLSKIDKTNGPSCLRTVKIILQKPTALDVTENGMIMAIGFDMGGITLYHGDIGRDKSKICKTLSNGTTPITGIKFKKNGKCTFMFVSSDSGILVYNIQSKDKESKIILDKTCAPSRCCAIENNNNVGIDFMIGRDDAIYCYTTDGRGPCYALEGEKSIIKWFRSHLITVSRQTKSIASTKKEFVLTVIDIQNKFIVFNTGIDNVAGIFFEFGHCFILTKNKKVFQLDEKDLQTKLSLLFKKKLYDIAIRIAKNQQYDAEGLAEIFKEYGDHLYVKGNYAGAIEQYSKTIGFLEPSYIIRRFLDSRHISYLTDYLQCLHKKQCATADHTTLLLNCFTRLGLTEKFKEFLSVNDDNSEVIFDTDSAIKISRNISTDLALSLSKSNEKQNEYISILIDDKKAYEEAINFISKLEIRVAENIIDKYGLILMNECPEKMTEMLKKLCIEEDSNPETVIKLYLKRSDNLINLLEYLIENRGKCSTAIYNTLIELYLKKLKLDNSCESRLLEILMFHKDSYDKNHILLLSRLYNFLPGTLFIYEEKLLYHLIIRYHLQNNDYEGLLDCCKSLGKSQPVLWLQALVGLRNNEKARAKLISQVLNVIVSEKLQSPLQVLNSLGVENGPKFLNVREYFQQIFKKESDLAKKDEAEFRVLKGDLTDVQNEIENIRTNAIEFRSTTCRSCHQPLTMPAVFFMCQHSFHQDCIRTFSDNEKECSSCHNHNSKLLEALKNNDPKQHEEFHNQLVRSSEAFDIVAKQFGKCLFNKILIVDESNDEYQVKKDIPKNLLYHSYGPGAEAKLRITEGRDKNAAAFQSIMSEGRMRKDENNRKDSSILIKNKTKKKTDENLTNCSTNPFETDEPQYDEAKNPFFQAAEVVANAIEKYDSNLNPFEKN